MGRRRRLSLLTLVLVALATVPAAAQAGQHRLTNLDHIDWLGDRVSPPAQAGHTTWRLAAEPSVGVLWTYADRQSDGSYRRIGGGTYDPATDTYGQGAFNADDIARAAVVYVRHWRQTGSRASRRQAYELLRGLTFMQTAEGPNAGNVVLWMQPDGTLRPSAEPRELPDPSDSGPSYWLARTVWALGEGYRAFRTTDRAFAGFLRERMELSIAALDRQVLSRYGRRQVVDGRSVPAWLIVDGADATSEAILGLAAYLDAGGSAAARTALDRFSEGVAQLRAGGPRDWPYGAVLPWALSRSTWHAWGSQMPGALAVSGRPDGLAAAISDTASFTPHLLVAGGPDNGWLPAPVDRTQIAYGADSRLQGLLAVARAAGRPGLRRVAGIAAAWYFGANAASAPMYDPRTGRTYDGVAADGTINRNSGAESTIHGLLSMLALDAAPDVARWAAAARPVARHTQQVLEAEAGTLSGGTAVVTPASGWTGESAWSGNAYVTLPPGGAVEFPAAGEPALVQPVAWRTEGAGGGSTRWPGLGELSHTDAGPQGASAVPGLLEVQRLAGEADAGTRIAAEQAADGTTQLDAVLVQPLVESVTLAGGRAAQALLRSFAEAPRQARIELPGSGRARIAAYDATGRRTATATARGSSVQTTIPPGGFAVAERMR